MRRFLHYINLLNISTLGTKRIIPWRTLLCHISTIILFPLFSFQNLNAQCPVITSQPASQTVCTGGSVTFAVTIDPNFPSPDSYHWYFGATDIGINSPSLTINPVSLSDAGDYHVELIKAGCTNVVSSVATLSVDPASVGGTTSGSATVCASSNSGSITLSGQTGSVINWQFSTDGGTIWTDISNTTSTQAYSNITQTTIYRAVVQSGV